MKAVVNYAPEAGSVETREVETPSIGPDDVLSMLNSIRQYKLDIQQADAEAVTWEQRADKAWRELLAYIMDGEPLPDEIAEQVEVWGAVTTFPASERVDLNILSKEMSTDRLYRGRALLALCYGMDQQRRRGLRELSYLKQIIASGLLVETSANACRCAASALMYTFAEADVPGDTLVAMCPSMKFLPRLRELGFTVEEIDEGDVEEGELEP